MCGLFSMLEWELGWTKVVSEGYSKRISAWGTTENTNISDYDIEILEAGQGLTLLKRHHDVFPHKGNPSR